LAPRGLVACTGFAYQHDGNYKVVNKGKVHPRTGHEGPEGE